jgi:hypothetical protein
VFPNYILRINESKDLFSILFITASLVARKQLGSGEKQQIFAEQINWWMKLLTDVGSEEKSLDLTYTIWTQNQKSVYSDTMNMSFP